MPTQDENLITDACPRCGAARDHGAVCSRCGASLPPPRNAAVGSPDSEFVAKTWDESGGIAAPAVPEPPTPTKPVAAAFRPRKRPPTATLIILDDGQPREGEKVRLRASRMVIGRKTGDILIPHDQGISNRHVELIRRDADQPGQATWELKDLESTNGTFLRVARGTLREGSELLLGCRRFVFRIEEPATDQVDSEHDTRDRPGRALNSLPTLVQGRPEKEEKRFPLSSASVTIGGSQQLAELTLSGDELLDPVHARIFQDERKRWRIEDADSRNGIWVRVRHVPLKQNCEFQIGEQRFRFLPGYA